MEMHQIRYFLAVCAERSFTRAAEQCAISQPALTRAIQKLEEELGGVLFHRKRSETMLTELGELVYPRLEQIDVTRQQVAFDVRDFKEQRNQRLRLGIMCTIGPTRTLNFLSRLRRHIPSLQLSILEDKAGKLNERLLSGELDVAIMSLPTWPNSLRVRELFTENYVVAFASGHRFEDMDAIPVDELSGESYLRRINCEWPDHARCLGLDLTKFFDIRFESERDDWIQAMILAGYGCTIMPETLGTLPGISTRLLIEPKITRRVALASVAGRPSSYVIQQIERLCQSYNWHK